MQKNLKVLLMAAVLSATTLMMTACDNINIKKEVNEAFFVANSTVAGIDISGKSYNQAIDVAQQALIAQMQDTKITVEFASGTEVISGENLKYTLQMDEKLDVALATFTPANAKLNYEVTTDNIKEIVSEVADKYVVEKQDAKLNGFNFENAEFDFTNEIVGTVVDVDATTQAIVEAFEKGKTATISAINIETNPDVTVAILKEQYGKLSSYQTVSTNTANGNSNMALALKRCSNLELKKGDEFSFNGLIGNSTYAGSGFLPANGIMAGLLVPMYGGGICQASSTIYIAALQCAMEITERTCHSMPSSYVPIGLDATVSYGTLDFKFKNPYDEPVYLVCGMEGKTLTATFYGKLPTEWDTIKVESWTSQTIAPPSQTVYRVDSNMKSGEYRRSTTGYNGYVAGSQAVYYKDDKEVKKEYIAQSTYKACAQTYYIGPGTDTSKISGSSGVVASPTPAPATPAPATPEPAVPSTPEPAPTTPEPAPATPAPDPTPDQPADAGVTTEDTTE